ncbi:MAG: aspartate kinase [Salinivirgaceae bacterium]|jgi:aspartate kinase|nr:aspartate kinase [Salinivirgaceae bacterium]
MVVNKFGGASIKDAESVKRTTEICKHKISNGIIVISAMGKITNLLEELTLKYFKNESYSGDLDSFKIFHLDIISALFPTNHIVFSKATLFFELLIKKLESNPSIDYDYEYDQIVPFGELLSTLIISEYLNYLNHKVSLIDIRKLLKTNDTYRNAKVDWEVSSVNVNKEFKNLETKLYLTQGFIGTDQNGFNTTLGREGSDYTAAALAYILQAEKVVVWKDVPGIMCADPAWIPDTDKIEQLSYLDAIELAYYGAKVIHPKTIKPLQNKKIPLQVRSFLEQENEGTVINSFDNLTLPPVYIKKDDQVLISIKPTDYSFIVEENLSHIFSILAENKITVNLMQNSAVSFSIVVDNELFRIKNAITELKNCYNVKYNDNLELITIRHHISGAENKVLNRRMVLVEQHTRSVARYLVR